MVSRSQKSPLCLVAIGIIVSGLHICLADVSDDQTWRKQLPLDSKPYSVGEMNVTSIPGTFNVTLKNSVRKGQEIIYTFNYTEYINTVNKFVYS